MSSDASWIKNTPTPSLMKTIKADIGGNKDYPNAYITEFYNDDA